MNFGSILYNLILGPLVLLFEFIYSIVYAMTGNPWLSIIALSLTMNLLVLPLYRRADALQEEERDQAASLKTGVDHIKKAFKGDERFMILQTYYRQNNYKPYYALKGSLSLLLEIPFFIAAYRFLSDLPLLSGASFGPIADLGAPDALIKIGAVAINVLPILMTVINIVSGAIYTKGMPAKTKLQLYGMALIFLVFLYKSPSGLVFYWTLNNLFSLVKNILYKLKHPRRVVNVLSSLLGIGILALALTGPDTSTSDMIFAVVMLVLLQLPLLSSIFFGEKRVKTAVEANSTDKFIFYASCIFLAVLTGLLIPTAVINASPGEFVDVKTMASPLRYILSSLLLAAGTFIIWFTVFYKLASASAKRTFSYAMLAVAGAAAVNYMFFGKGYGNMSSELAYDNLIAPAFKEYILNGVFIGVAVLVLLLLVKKLPNLMKTIMPAACIAVAAMSVINIFSINAELKKIKGGAKRDIATENISFTLDKNGRNVVVIMLDRAISGFVPYIFEENPTLKEQFSGFTYYPNTISYGGYTNVGSPPLYGGYEYTPEEMNRRDKEPLCDKQNEALKVMPVNFLNAGYDVTVCDPTYAGYSWIPDLTIYDDYPEINTYVTMGKFTKDWYLQHDLTGKGFDELILRNLFCYSLFRVSPVAIHRVMYDSGQYRDLKYWQYRIQTRSGMSKAEGYSNTFISPYSVLCSLDGMTRITDGGNGSFLMMSNDTTHEPALLSEPDYTPAFSVDNTEYDEAHRIRYSADGSELELVNEKQMTHYHVNMAAYIELGKWFDYLRENGVYDNTKIILVSDHGRDLGLFDMKIGDRTEEDLMWYNALLMVKDFGAEGFTTDNTFMTNADTPTLAFDGVIENAENPSTGKLITADQKNESEQHIAYSALWSVKDNDGNVFRKLTWLAVKNDYFDLDGWRVMKGE